MTLYGRIQPDSLGRPARLWFNARARQLLGAGRWDVEAQDDSLLLRRDQSGLALAEKTGTLSIGAVLDTFNQDGELTNEPFPIRQVRDGFECLIRQPNPALSARGSRITAMPMRVIDRQIMRRQQYNTADFVQLFALLELARQQPLTTEQYQAPDDLLAKMPTLETILARFGTFKRFEGYVAYQRARLERHYPTPDLAHDRLMELLHG